MPELYGQPFKDELRKKIRELSNDLYNEQKEHRETRDALDVAQSRIALLTKKIRLMEGKLKDLLSEASREISSDELWTETKQRRKARRDAMWDAAEAKAKAEAASA